MSTQEKDGTATLTPLEKVTRRSFLSRAGAVGVATATAAFAAPAAGAASPEADQVFQETAEIPGTVPITLKVNGEVRRLRVFGQLASSFLNDFVQEFANCSQLFPNEKSPKP